MSIASFTDFHNVFSSYRKDNRWMFRGQADVAWQVVPKAGRQPYANGRDLINLQAWKRRASEFLVARPQDDWEWLAIAQHHGLPTRLLDWTYNPLVAAFFACMSEPEADGVVYCLQPYYEIFPERGSPFDHKTKVARYKPSVVAARIGRQSGLFTAHPEPGAELVHTLAEEDKFETHIISKRYKKEMLFELNFYGINQMTLMGDLDGLSAHMRWTNENRRYWSDHDEFMRELHGTIVEP